MHQFVQSALEAANQGDKNKAIDFIKQVLAANPNDVDAWLVPSEQSRELASLAQRNMQLQVNRQDGIVWVADGDRSVEIHPRRLSAEPR